MALALGVPAEDLPARLGIPAEEIFLLVAAARILDPLEDD